MNTPTNMKPIDRLSILVTTMLEPAIAAGLPAREAKAIHSIFMEFYADAQARRPDFADVLSNEVMKTLIILNGAGRN